MKPDDGLLDVLWVDSDPRALKAAGFLLAERCRFQGVETLAQARLALAGGNPDLILCEQQLADGSGLDFMASLARENQPAFRIIMAGVGRIDALRQALDQGTVHLSLSKPIRESELTMVMSLVRERHRLRRQNSELLDKVEHQAQEISGFQDLFRRLFEYLPEAVLVTDRSGRVLMANHRAESALKVSSQALVGRLIDGLLDLAWPDPASKQVVHQTAILKTPEVAGRAVELTILMIGAPPDGPCLLIFPVGPIHHR